MGGAARGGRATKGLVVFARSSCKKTHPSSPEKPVISCMTIGATGMARSQRRQTHSMTLRCLEARRRGECVLVSDIVFWRTFSLLQKFQPWENATEKSLAWLLTFPLPHAGCMLQCRTE